MILLKKILLAFFGLYAGGITAAGVYAFLAVIGMFVRLMGKTGIRRRIILHKTVIMLGGVLGSIMDIYKFPVYTGSFIDTILLAAAGVCVGIFVGCLVISLAGALKALPVTSRRIHLAVGLQYLIFALAAGKFIGSLAYFWSHMTSVG